MRLYAVVTALLWLCPLCGCRFTPKADFSAPLVGERAESQWEMILEENGNSLIFTGAVAIGVEQPHEGRLYVILPYGQTLTKCVLTKGHAICQSAPGADSLARKTSEPMARMMEAVFKAGRGGVFTPAKESLPSLWGKGWRADRDGPWLVYAEDGAVWRLKVKRNA